MSARKADDAIEVGQELPVRRQTVTQEAITRFHEVFGGSNAIHTDPEVARQNRFEAPLQHAARTIYPVFAMLFERYPTGLVAGGRLQAKFIGPVIPGDVITCHCRAAERRDDGGRQVLVFEAWAENQKGEKVAVGTATVVERDR